MSNSANRILSLPSALVLEKGLHADRVRLLTASIVLVSIGLARGASAGGVVCMTALPVWFIIAVFIDIFAFVADDSSGKASWLDSSLATLVFTVANIPVVFFFCISFLEGIFNVFHFGFWRELIAISIALAVQVAIVTKLPPPSFGRESGLVMRGIRAAIQGLVPTSGACILGFSIFLLFHLVAQSLLPDRAVVFVEEHASLFMERLEHPFGDGYPRIATWLIVVLVFAALAFANRPRLTSGIAGVRRWESIAETSLIAFLCFTLTCSQMEQFGIRREITLANKATKRAYAAYALKASALELSDDQKVALGFTLSEIREDKEPEEEVTVKAISHIEDGRSFDDGISYLAGDEDALIEDGDIGQITLSSHKSEPRLLQIKEKRIQEENRAEAATNALLEVLSQTNSQLLGAAFANDKRTTELLVSAVSDFVSDNSEYSLEKVCSRVLRVLSGGENPIDPSLPAARDLVKKSEDEVNESHGQGSRDSKYVEGKKDVEHDFHAAP